LEKNELSRRLNRWGRRFGFVRFFEVTDIFRLEKELDQIYIGNMKLHVNLPRYRKDEYDSHKEAPKHRIYDTKGMNYKQGRKDKEEVKYKEVWKEKKGKKLYVEAVRGSSSQEIWKGPIIETKKQILPWMGNSVVGHMIADLDFSQLCEELVKGGINKIKTRYLGDNMVMLTPVDGECMEKLIKENRVWMESFFEVINSWSDEYLPGHKIVWVRCTGLPLSLWNRDCFAKVVEEVASLISIDEDTMNWENLEYARLQVRLLRSCNVRLSKAFKINGKIYNINIEEELPYGREGKSDCRYNQYDSSDSITSSETYVEDTIFSENNFNEDYHGSVAEEETIGERERKEQEHPESLPRGSDTEGGILQVTVENSIMGKATCGQGENDIAPDSMSRPMQSKPKSVQDVINNLLVAVEAVKSIQPMLGSAHSFINTAQSLSIKGKNSVRISGKTEVGESESVNEETPKKQVSKDLGEGESSPITKNRGLVSATSSNNLRGAVNQNVAEASEGPQTSIINHGGVGMEGGKGDPKTIVMARFSGEDELEYGGNYLTPQYGWRQRGLCEIGETSRKPRWKYLTKKGDMQNETICESRLVLNSISNSFSEDGINNCNKRFWTSFDIDRPVKLWELGKQIGISCEANEVEAINEMVLMEKKDLKGKKKGGKGRKHK